MSIDDPAQPFLRQCFGTKAARDGAVIRRKIRDVDRQIGCERFLAEIDRRGYQVVENAGQFVVFCNREPIRPVGSRAPFSWPKKMVQKISNFLAT